jgi:hypothetical protein
MQPGKALTCGALLEHICLVFLLSLLQQLFILLLLRLAVTVITAELV